MSDADSGTGRNSNGIGVRKKEMNLGYGSHESGTQTCSGKAAQKGGTDWKAGRNSIGIGGSGGQEGGFPARVDMKENAQCRHAKNKIKSQQARRSPENKIAMELFSEESAGENTEEFSECKSEERAEERQEMKKGHESDAAKTIPMELSRGKKVGRKSAGK